MKTPIHYLRYAALVIVVTVLGGLSGWYLFVNKEIRNTGAQDASRGFGDEQTFGGRIGSTLGNIVGSMMGDSAVDGSTTTRSGAPKLWQITRTPVAGLQFASSSPRLFFAERASGNILIADPGTSKVDRLTNTLIPRVYEALFSGDGSVVLRSLDENGTMTSYAAVIATSTSPAAGDTPNKLEGVYLPHNIVSIASRGGTKSLFFILRETQGAAGITSNWAGGNQKRVLSSALSDWRAAYMDDGTLYIVQKPADDVSGYAFKVLPSGALERVAGDVPGLMILPRNKSSALIYSSSGGGALTLYAKTGDSTTETRIPIRTVAEKCVWAPGSQLIAYCAVPQTSPTGTFLRNWFDGTVHTSDAWWRVDVSANTVEQIYAPEITVALDVESPVIDASGRYVAFMNAADKTLWMLTLDK